MSRISSHATLDALLARLIAPQAATRRTAARMLRKLKIQATGPSVLSALKWEINDPKAWETQYQMIMALGECGYAEALPYLRGLSKSPRSKTMLGVALATRSSASPGSTSTTPRRCSRSSPARTGT